MKRFLSLLVVAGLTAGSAQAQLRPRNTVALGVKAGGTIATFVGSASNLERSTYGFLAGLALQIGKPEGFYVQPELLYSQKGSKNNQTGYSTTRSLNYLDIPVAVRYQSGEWFGEVGPQVGFLLAAQAKTDTGGDKTDVKEAFHDVDAGYLLGVGYQPARGGFGVGARYNGAFRNAPKDVAGTEVNLRNSAVQFYVTYFVKHRRRH